jgi:hypothetical protein
MLSSNLGRVPGHSGEGPEDAFQRFLGEYRLTEGAP